MKRFLVLITMLGTLLCAKADNYAAREFKTPADAAARDSLLQIFLKSAGVDTARVAISITDLRSGEEIVGYRSGAPMIPASILKCLTAASILRDRGADWRYTTDVMLQGNVSGDTLLMGNILVKGAGDPTLNARTSPASPDILSEIVEALQSRGIRRIVGGIRVDNGLFAGPSTPDSWASGDLPHSYGTGSHAFNFENNAVGKSAVSHPDKRFESALRSALRRAGIELTDSVMDPARRTLLVSHRSAPLEEILRSCVMRSDNLYAESMLRTYGSGVNGDGSTRTAAAREMRTCAQRGLPMLDVEVIDGSGLSRSNRVTARFMDALLQNMSDSDTYVSLFPLAGKEGTLRNFLRNTPLDSYMALKTGSMSGIQCYAGYLLDDRFAPTHSVVVMANSLPEGRQAFRDALSALLLNLFTPSSNYEL